MVFTSEIGTDPQIQCQRNEDFELVTLFLQGDRHAFDTLVHKYRRQVYSVAWRFTQNHEEADDLTQETFVKAYSNLNTFRRDASFKTWLLRITTNLSINNAKSGRIRKDSGDEADDHITTFNPEALASLLADERKRELHQALSQLPPKQKQTLLLKTYRDMTCEEVAGVMGCTTGTVKANIFNALKKLKTLLGEGVRA